MSKTSKRKSSESGKQSDIRNPSTAKDTSVVKRQSVFERLGTKATSSRASSERALSVNTSIPEAFCRSWALNGTCSHDKSCKLAHSHTLISPSKRSSVKKDSEIVHVSGVDKNRLVSSIKHQSPDVGTWDNFEPTELEYEDEKVLEKRRAALQRELELQMKKDGSRKEVVKTRRSSSTSSLSSTSSVSSSSSTSSRSSVSVAKKTVEKKRQLTSSSSESEKKKLAMKGSSRKDSPPRKMSSSSSRDQERSKGRSGASSPLRQLQSRKRSISPPRKPSPKTKGSSDPYKGITLEVTLKNDLALRAGNPAVRRKESPVRRGISSDRRSRRSSSRSRRRSPVIARSAVTRRSRPRSPPRPSTSSRVRTPERKKEDERRKDDRRDRKSVNREKKVVHEDSRSRDKARELAREKERLEALERCRERQREREKDKDRIRDDRDRKDPKRSNRDISRSSTVSSDKRHERPYDRFDRSKGSERDRSYDERERVRDRALERMMERKSVDRPRERSRDKYAERGNYSEPRRILPPEEKNYSASPYRSGERSRYEPERERLSPRDERLNRSGYSEDRRDRGRSRGWPEGQQSSQSSRYDETNRERDKPPRSSGGGEWASDRGSDFQESGSGRSRDWDSSRMRDEGGDDWAGYDRGPSGDWHNRQHSHHHHIDDRRDRRHGSGSKEKDAHPPVDAAKNLDSIESLGKRSGAIEESEEPIKRSRLSEPPAFEELSDISDDEDILNRVDPEFTEGEDSRMGDSSQAAMCDTSSGQGERTDTHMEDSMHAPSPKLGEDENMVGLDFEEISDEELEEEKINRGGSVGDALGVDWASLMAECRPQKKKPEESGENGVSSVRARWEASGVLSRLSVSSSLASPEYLKRLKEKFPHVVPGVTAQGMALSELRKELQRTRNRERRRRRRINQITRLRMSTAREEGGRGKQINQRTRSRRSRAREEGKKRRKTMNHYHEGREKKRMKVMEKQERRHPKIDGGIRKKNHYTCAPGKRLFFNGHVKQTMSNRPSAGDLTTNFTFPRCNSTSMNSRSLELKIPSSSNRSSARDAVGVAHKMKGVVNRRYTREADISSDGDEPPSFARNEDYRYTSANPSYKGGMAKAKDRYRVPESDLSYNGYEPLLAIYEDFRRMSLNTGNVARPEDGYCTVGAEMTDGNKTPPSTIDKNVGRTSLNSAGDIAGAEVPALKRTGTSVTSFNHQASSMRHCPVAIDVASVGNKPLSGHIPSPACPSSNISVSNMPSADIDDNAQFNFFPVASSTPIVNPNQNSEPAASQSIPPIGGFDYPQYCLLTPIKNASVVAQLRSKDVINYFHQHPVLWNREHPNYKDPELRLSLLTDLASKIGEPVNKLKSRWLKLKLAYKNNYVKFTSTGVRSLSRNYEAMSFLEREIQKELWPEYPKRDLAQQHLQRIHWNSDTPQDEGLAEQVHPLNLVTVEMDVTSCDSILGMTPESGILPASCTAQIDLGSRHGSSVIPQEKNRLGDVSSQKMEEEPTSHADEKEANLPIEQFNARRYSVIEAPGNRNELKSSNSNGIPKNQNQLKSSSTSSGLPKNQNKLNKQSAHTSNEMINNQIKIKSSNPICHLKNLNQSKSSNADGVSKNLNKLKSSNFSGGPEHGNREKSPKSNNMNRHSNELESSDSIGGPKKLNRLNASNSNCVSKSLNKPNSSYSNAVPKSQRELTSSQTANEMFKHQNQLKSSIPNVLPKELNQLKPSDACSVSKNLGKPDDGNKQKSSKSSSMTGSSNVLKSSNFSGGSEHGNKQQSSKPNSMPINSNEVKSSDSIGEPINLNELKALNFNHVSKSSNKPNSSTSNDVPKNQNELKSSQSNEMFQDSYKSKSSNPIAIHKNLNQLKPSSACSVSKNLGKLKSPFSNGGPDHGNNQKSSKSNGMTRNSSELKSSHFTGWAMKSYCASESRNKPKSSDSNIKPKNLNELKSSNPNVVSKNVSEIKSPNFNVEVQKPSLQKQNQISAAIINHYYHNPVLWDSKHPNFMNRDLSLSLLTELASKLGEPVSKVKSRWASLKLAYKKKYLGLSTVRSLNQYHEAMSFLKFEIEQELQREQFERDLTQQQLQRMNWDGNTQQVTVTPAVGNIKGDEGLTEFNPLNFVTVEMDAMTQNSMLGSALECGIPSSSCTAQIALGRRHASSVISQEENRFGDAWSQKVAAEPVSHAAEEETNLNELKPSNSHVRPKNWNEPPYSSRVLKNWDEPFRLLKSPNSSEVPKNLNKLGSSNSNKVPVSLREIKASNSNDVPKKLNCRDVSNLSKLYPSNFNEVPKHLNEIKPSNCSLQVREPSLISSVKSNENEKACHKQNRVKSTHPPCNNSANEQFLMSMLPNIEELPRHEFRVFKKIAAKLVSAVLDT